jgi:hypothetical protein
LPFFPGKNGCSLEVPERSTVVGTCCGERKFLYSSLYIPARSIAKQHIVSPLSVRFGRIRLFPSMILLFDCSEFLLPLRWQVQVLQAVFTCWIHITSASYVPRASTLFLFTGQPEHTALGSVNGTEKVLATRTLIKRKPLTYWG